MLGTLLVLGAVLALGIGVYIGLGAPGWPSEPDGQRKHTERRPLNPIAWGRTSNRDRLRVRTPEERRPRLR